MRFSIAQSVLESSVTDSTWTSPIFFPSTVWYNTVSNGQSSLQINQSSSPSMPTSSYVDIVQLMKPPSVLNKSILEQFLKYPKHCSFMFEGYSDSKESITSLKNNILSAARSNGQQLSVRHSTKHT